MFTVLSLGVVCRLVGALYPAVFDTAVKSLGTILAIGVVINVMSQLIEHWPQRASANLPKVLVVSHAAWTASGPEESGRRRPPKLCRWRFPKIRGTILGDHQGKGGSPYCGRLPSGFYKRGTPIYYDCIWTPKYRHLMFAYSPPTRV